MSKVDLVIIVTPGRRQVLIQNINDISADNVKKEQKPSGQTR